VAAVMTPPIFKLGRESGAILMEMMGRVQGANNHAGHREKQINVKEEDRTKANSKTVGQHNVAS